MISAYFRRLAGAVRSSPRRPPIVFMHVPKTGGTSLDGALERLYKPTTEANLAFHAVTNAWRLAQSYQIPGSEHDLKWFDVINTALCYKIARGAPYLSGHFAVTEELLAQAKAKYRFVTLLRDPLARWKSNYVYSRIREAQDGKRAIPQDIAAELRDYLDSPLARREGAKYVRYLGGFRKVDGLEDRQTIDAAKQLLARFDVVGVLENMGRFESKLSELVGSRIRVPHLRKTDTFDEPGGFKPSDYKALFTPEVEERVRALCAPDYEVYQHACSLENARET